MSANVTIVLEDNDETHGVWMYYGIRICFLVLSIIWSYFKRQWKSRTTLINSSKASIKAQYFQFRWKFSEFSQRKFTSEEQILTSNTFASGRRTLWFWDYWMCGISIFIDIEAETNDNDQQIKRHLVAAVYDEEFPPHRVLRITDEGLYVDNILCALWHNLDIEPSPVDIKV